MSVEEMLRELTWLTSAMEHGEYTGDQLEESITDLSKKLHSLLISKLPEKTIGAPVDEYETGGECGAYADGFNQAIDNMRKSIDEMFRSGDENS